MGINLNAGFIKILEGKRSYRDFEGKKFLMLGKQHVNFDRSKLKTVLESYQFEYRKDIVDFERDTKSWIHSNFSESSVLKIYMP